MEDLSGYEIYVKFWYDSGCMSQPANEGSRQGPFKTIAEARTVYDSQTGKDFVARKLIELIPKRVADAKSN